MTTKSLIGILNPDNTVNFIFCRNFGHPSGVGSILTNDYNSPETVAALLDLGDLVFLGYDPKHSVAYGRDQNKPNAQAEVNIPLSIFLSMDYRDEDYKYLFNTDGKWQCFEHDGTPVDLKLKIEN